MRVFWGRCESGVARGSADSLHKLRTQSRPAARASFSMTNSVLVSERKHLVTRRKSDRCNSTNDEFPRWSWPNGRHVHRDHDQPTAPLRADDCTWGSGMAARSNVDASLAVIIIIMFFVVCCSSTWMFFLWCGRISIARRLRGTRPGRQIGAAGLSACDVPELLSFVSLATM